MSLDSILLEPVTNQQYLVNPVRGESDMADMQVYCRSSGIISYLSHFICPLYRLFLVVSSYLNDFVIIGTVPGG